MLRIALCDENPYHMHEVEAVLTTILFDRIEFDMLTYKNGMELVEAIRSKNFATDLLIMDIDMQQVNGLQIAKFMRKSNILCDIVFLTGNKEFVLEGYKYSAFDYLLKPVSVKVLQRMIDRYISTREFRTPFFYFKNQNSYNRVNLNKIEYFSGEGRKATVYASGFEGSFYRKIDEIEQEVCKRNNFLRPHQSYIVNIDYIIEFTSNKIVTESGMEIPIAKKRYHETKEKFRTYVGSKLVE